MATRKASAPTKAPAAKATRAKATKPAPVEKAPRAEAIEFGSAWLVEHVNAETESSYSASALRILLRKLTADGVLPEREGRARYNFAKGANDPEVKAIVKAVKGGAAEKAKAERLEGLKEQRAAKAKAAPAKKTRAPKAAVAAAPEVEEEDELEVDEI